MKRKIKNCLALVMTLVLALALAVPVLAADSSEDGYTVVMTGEGLLEELEKGTAKIRFGADIELSPEKAGMTLGSLDLDLNGHTWTVTAQSGDGINGGNAAFYLRGTAAVRIQNGTIRVQNRDDSMVLWQYGGTLSLIGVTMNGGVACQGTIDRISQCSIIRNCEENLYGTAALWVDGTVGTVTQSTIAGKGVKVSGITLSSGSIGSIENCTITGSGDRPGLLNQGSIGAITVGEDNTIDSIEGGTIGSAEVQYGIMNYGTIGSIQNCTITGLHDSICTYGTIGSIAKNTLIATADVGRGIEVVAPGSIQTLSGNNSTSPNAFIIVHQDAVVGEITNNTANAAIFNGGKGAGTINLISGNTITTSKYYAIYNGGTLTTLGDNTLTVPEGEVGVWNEGTIQTVSVPVSESGGNRYTAESGWTLLNDGTIENLTLPDYSLRFVGQIRLIEPWGLRINVAALNNGTAVEQSAVRSVRIGFVQGTGSYQWITAAQNGNYYSADFTGIQTQYLNTPIRFAAEVTLTDGTVIESGDKTVNLLELLKSSASSSANSAKERAVYQAIVNWFNAYQSYLGK